VNERPVGRWGDDEDALDRNDLAHAVDGVLEKRSVRDEVEELLGAVPPRPWPEPGSRST